ncbi:MAG: repressor LexA, partial [Firmicutes bacterium]|nr:repressor LexA [Bacillota bacterium]
MLVDPDEETGTANRFSNAERTDVVEIPVVGRVAAGTPILAEENIEDSFPVPSRYVTNGTSFMLTVKGESMIEAGIMDGDYILVQQQNTARNGDIVVAMIDGFESEATVKTFYKEDNHIRLQPENSTMNPIIVKDVRILGKVTGVFRYFN